MKIKFLALTLATLLFTGCGGGSNNSENKSDTSADHIIKATQTAIKGDLKGCFEVVDKDYKVKESRRTWEVTVELKRTAQELPYDRKDVAIYPEAKESAKSMLAGLGIELLDADGNVIDKKAANATPYSWDEMTAAIQLLPEETTTVKYVFYDDISSATGFRITSIVEKNDKNSLSEITDIEDAEKAFEAAGKAIETVDKAMETTGKMMEALGNFK